MSYTTGFKGRYGLWGAQPAGYHSRQTPHTKRPGGAQDKAKLAQSVKPEYKDNHPLRDKNVQDLKTEELKPTTGDQMQDREMNAQIRE